MTFVAYDIEPRETLLTGTEPLNEDGSPHIANFETVKLEMEDKMVQIKKVELIDKDQKPSSFL